MKITDLLKISTNNIRVHLRRNLMLVVVMGVLFGLIFAINLLMTGLTNSYTTQASYITDGRVVLLATNSTEGMVADTQPARASRAEMVADIEAHGGSVLGEAERFGPYGSLVLPAELVQNAIEIDPSQAPADAAPVLATTFLGETLLGRDFSLETATATDKQQAYAAFRAALLGQTFADASGAKYYIVGFANGNFHLSNLSFQQLDRRNQNPLNPILETIPTPDGVPIVLNQAPARPTGSASDNLSAYEQLLLETMASDADTIVAVFQDHQSAYAYFRDGQGAFPNTAFSGRTYSVTIVAGLSPEATYILSSINAISILISIALGIVAVIVIIFTTIRLIDQDQANLKLYYSLGATSRQVRSIYLGYFLELMFGASLFAFILASLIVFLFSAFNQTLLGVQAQLGFNQISPTPVWWYDINPTTLFIWLTMLLMAPLCVLCCRRKLSAASAGTGTKVL